MQEIRHQAAFHVFDIVSAKEVALIIERVNLLYQYQFRCTKVPNHYL